MGSGSRGWTKEVSPVLDAEETGAGCDLHAYHPSVKQEVSPRKKKELRQNFNASNFNKKVLPVV